MAHRVKHPLDILQSMVNGVLIETGKALKASDKEGGQTFATANTRLRTTIPSAVENFHHALDELEYDIVRAKAVLLRDLEELRSKRYALENPAPVVEEPVTTEDQSMLDQPIDNETNKEADVSAPEAVMIKDKARSNSPVKQEEGEASTQASAAEIQDDLFSSIAMEESKSQQGATSPNPKPEMGSDNKPIGLGINTEDIPAATSAPENSGVAPSSVDSLFDIPDNDNNAEDLNLDGMDFLQDTNTITDNPEESQTQANDFDLSTFDMPDMQDAEVMLNDTTTDGDANKQLDDIFNITTDGGNADTMDLDLDLGMAGESTFDDMFLVGEDGNMAGGDMEFDNAFFGVDE